MNNEEKAVKTALRNLMEYTEDYENRLLQHGENITDKPEYKHQKDLEIVKKALDDYFKIKKCFTRRDSLRDNFVKMAKEILGEDYFNMGTDVCETDRLCCEDIVKAYNNRFRVSDTQVPNDNSSLLALIQEMQEIKSMIEEIREFLGIMEVNGHE